MAATTTTPTGLDYELIPGTTTTTTTTFYQAPYLIEEHTVTLMTQDSIVEEHIIHEVGAAFPAPPAEFFSAAPTSWTMSRPLLMPWACPEYHDENGNLIFEAKLCGLLQPQAKLVNKTSGLVAYTSAPTAFFEWKNPYNIFIGGGETTQPYASVIRTLTLSGLKLSIQFATGEPTLEIHGKNWHNRRFHIYRGTVRIATIRRRRFYTYEYTIAAGENIPLISLLVQILAIIVIRNRR